MFIELRDQPLLELRRSGMSTTLSLLTELGRDKEFRLSTSRPDGAFQTAFETSKPRYASGGRP